MLPCAVFQGGHRVSDSNEEAVTLGSGREEAEIVGIGV